MAYSKNVVSRLIEEIERLKKENKVLKEKQKENQHWYQLHCHKRKLDAMSVFAGSIARDINNMLGGIMGFIQLLKSPKMSIDPKGMRYVDMIVKTVGRGADFTSKLLTFGHNGHCDDLEMNIINFDHVIDHAISILNRNIDEKIALSINKRAKKVGIKGDSSALQNVLINMGMNAIEAISEGGKIEIEMTNKTIQKGDSCCNPFDLDSGDYLEIKIRDNGGGILPEHLDHIFDPFFTTKDRGKWAGLGLSVAYGIIRYHLGSIIVESTFGKGSCFQILLPCCNEPVSIKSEPLDLAVGSGTVLVVDDERIVRIMVQDMLEEMGYTVLVAEDGVQGVAIFKEQHHLIDCVVMDMMMPVMSGEEAFFQMKAIDSGCKIIISSGFMKNDILNRMKASGLEGFIKKPYRNYELNKLIQSVIGGDQK